MSLKGIFLGTSGVYHVMSELSFRNFHAAATQGNAPDFDILVCSRDGSTSVAIQVKSARWAKRKAGQEFDFPFSYKAAKINRTNVFFAFVDFGAANEHRKPDVYIVPSTETFRACQGWIDNFEGKSVWFKPKLEWMASFKDGWDHLQKAGVAPEVDEANSVSILETTSLSK